MATHNSIHTKFNEIESNIAIYLLQYNKADASNFTSSVINTTHIVL